MFASILFDIGHHLIVELNCELAVSAQRAIGLLHDFANSRQFLGVELDRFNAGIDQRVTRTAIIDDIRFIEIGVDRMTSRTIA